MMMNERIVDSYIRIKIFTEKGRDDHGKVELILRKNGDDDYRKIENLAARVIEPNGTITELTKTDILETEVARGFGAKFTALKFVFRSAKPGAIVEYRYRIKEIDRRAPVLRFEFASDLPIRWVKHTLMQPDKNLTAANSIANINLPKAFAKDPDGKSYSLELADVRPFQKEEFMPPLFHTQPAAIVSGAFVIADTQLDEYWRDQSRRLYKWSSFKNLTSDAVRKKAKQLANGKSELETVDAIVDFINSEIAVVETRTLREVATRTFVTILQTPEETLRMKVGSSLSRNNLFLAMLNEVGIDTRIANVSSRDGRPFDKRLSAEQSLPHQLLTMKLDGKWRFARFLDNKVAFWYLPPELEGQTAAIPDPDTMIFEKTPVSHPSASKRTRIAKLKLGDDGTLTGDMSVEMTGHLAYSKRLEMISTTDAEKQIAARAVLLNGVMGSQQLTDVSIENMDDLAQPLRFSGKLMLSGFADLSGSRVFFAPNIFEQSQRPFFMAEQRRFDIDFEHAWSESDKIEIQYPAGFKPESIRPAAAAKLADDNAQLRINTRFNASSNTLYQDREWEFGSKQRLTYPVVTYRELRAAFEEFQRMSKEKVMLVRK